MKEVLDRALKQALKNPKTSTIGLLQFAGALWWLAMHHDSITPDHLMSPESLPSLTLAVGAFSSFFAADAKGGGNS